jgi:hypothetical protein
MPQPEELRHWRDWKDLLAPTLSLQPGTGPEQVTQRQQVERQGRTWKHLRPSNQGPRDAVHLTAQTVEQAHLETLPTALPIALPLRGAELLKTSGLQVHFQHTESGQT